VGVVVGLRERERVDWQSPVGPSRCRRRAMKSGSATMSSSASLQQKRAKFGSDPRFHFKATVTPMPLSDALFPRHELGNHLWLLSFRPVRRLVHLLVERLSIATLSLPGRQGILPEVAEVVCVTTQAANRRNTPPAHGESTTRAGRERIGLRRKDGNHEAQYSGTCIIDCDVGCGADFS